MFHFQGPVDNWPQAIPILSPGYFVKSVDDVQMLSEAKSANSSIKTVLRHWYTAQVPGFVLENLDEPSYLRKFQARADYHIQLNFTRFGKVPRRKSAGYTWLQVPADTVADNYQRARDFFDSFVDGTFIEHAANVDYVEEWNEYFGNGMPDSERQRFVAWAKAAAVIWENEYRTREGLTHIRLILANTAVGNDIPFQVAQIAEEHNCLLGYHAYWPTKSDYVPDDAWPYYEGRWTAMDANFIAQGAKVDWALTEAGPILYYGDWPAVSLGCMDGWRHPDVHNAGIDRFLVSIHGFMNDWHLWNSSHHWRCSSPMLFTSGRFGWEHFQIHQPHLNDIATFIYQWQLDPPPPPPPPPSDPDPGHPREQYERVYNVIPPEATKAQANAIFREARDRSLETVGYSYDDAGIGALQVKFARLYGIPNNKVQTMIDWYDEFYPGTRIEFEDLPDV